MTAKDPTMPDEIKRRLEPTQADREAAAKLIESYFHDPMMLQLAQDFRAGHLFGPWPAAFAAQRLTGYQEGLKEGVQVADAMVAYADRDTPKAAGSRFAATAIASTLRNKLTELEQQP